MYKEYLVIKQSNIWIPLPLGPYGNPQWWYTHPPTHAHTQCSKVTLGTFLQKFFNKALFLYFNCSSIVIHDQQPLYTVTY